MERTEAVARAAWEAARATLLDGAHHLVVLDEITYPVNWGWIDGDDVVATIRDRPPHVNVVVTGRDAPAALCDAADTVTEMTSLKHAFDEGIVAMRGIEF
jgi:cob(I)alamin adenosyltransferase